MRFPAATLAVVGLVLAAAACAATGNTECDVSPPVYEERDEQPDHVATEVRFQSDCVTLAGTLYQPLGDGPFPTMVFLHGSGEAPRLGFGGPWITTPLVEHGIAVLSYDKRGVGKSEGKCCPDEDDDFEILTSDGLAAIDALAARDDVGPVGLFGVSQGGWVIPKMVARSDEVAFSVILSGSAVSVGEEIAYSALTGEPETLPTDIDIDSILAEVREDGASGFDPRPLLREYSVPGLWLYGARDGSQPTHLDVEVLESISDEHDRDFTVEVFQDLGHNLGPLHQGIDPAVIETMLTWIDRVTG